MMDMISYIQENYARYLWLSLISISIFSFTPLAYKNMRTLAVLCSEVNTCNLTNSLVTRYSRSIINNHEYSSVYACQMLTISRLTASKSIPQAIITFNNANSCDRIEQVALLGGELGWKSGNDAQAIRWWRELSVDNLLTLAYQRAVGRDLEQSKFLANIAVEKISLKDLQISDIPRFSLLGHVYRLSGDWFSANKFYELSHHLNSENLEIIFFLGMSYRQIKDSRAAIDVLEKGLPALHEQQPIYSGDYYIQLGLAFSETGQYQRALDAYISARKWAASRNAALEHLAFIQSLIDQTQALILTTDQP